MNAGVIERCSKYEKVSPAGVVCIMWPIEAVAATVSLKVILDTQNIEIYILMSGIIIDTTVAGKL